MPTHKMKSMAEDEAMAKVVELIAEAKRCRGLSDEALGHGTLIGLYEASLRLASASQYLERASLVAQGGAL